MQDNLPLIDISNWSPWQEGHGLGMETWIQILTPLLRGCGNLGKEFRLTNSQFSHL